MVLDPAAQVCTCGGGWEEGGGQKGSVREGRDPDLDYNRHLFTTQSVSLSCRLGLNTAGKWPQVLFSCMTGNKYWPLLSLGIPVQPLG